MRAGWVVAVALMSGAAPRGAEACERSCVLVAAAEGVWPSGGSVFVSCPYGGGVLSPSRTTVHLEVDGATLTYANTAALGRVRQLELPPLPVGTVVRGRIGSRPIEAVIGEALSGALEVAAQVERTTVEEVYSLCGSGPVGSTQLAVTEVTASSPVAAWLLTEGGVDGRLVDATTLERDLLIDWPVPGYGYETLLAFRLYGPPDLECADVVAVDFAGRRTVVAQTCPSGCTCTTASSEPGVALLLVLLAVLGRARRAA